MIAHARLAEIRQMLDDESLSLRDIARGRSRSVPTLRYKLAVALSRVVPSRIVGSITGGRQ